MEVIEFIDSLFFRKATWIWLNFVCVRQIIYTKYLVVSKTSFTFAPRKGEVLEWLKRHAWKACIPQKGIRGSNPRLSARNSVTSCKTTSYAIFRLKCAPVLRQRFNRYV